jgi:crotonobetainyl-CoA:carnitine CoA-transferase CaiB-like acyl-CoA transferase
VPEATPAAGLSSFAGLRVVELGVWVAAPSAAALLADWGADVVKVEPPAGDPMRRAFGSLGIGDDLRSGLSVQLSDVDGVPLNARGGTATRRRS